MTDAPFPSKQQIADFIRDAQGHVGKREIARAFKLDVEQKRRLKKVLKEMKDEGSLTAGRGRKLADPEQLPNVSVLEITGVGYRAQAQGKKLKLQLGYSHDVDLDVPEGLEVKTPDQTTVEISGIDKQAVGQFAAEVRRWRKPEPYKGKGIKYRGEYIFRKEGKKK